MIEAGIVETSRNSTVGFTPIEFEPCSVAHLDYVYEQEKAERIFYSYGMTNKFCTKVGATITFKGQYNTNAESLIGMSIIAKPCYVVNSNCSKS